MIVFALKEHQIRIQTGYGLEGSLPDTWIGTLSREVAREYFRGGRYAEGLYQLTLAVVHQVAADAGVTIENAPPPRFKRPARASRGLFPCFIVLLVLDLHHLQKQPPRARQYFGRLVLQRDALGRHAGRDDARRIQRLVE